MQVAEPGKTLKVLLGHALQPVAPAPEYSPGWHAAHVALEDAPVAALAVPAGQSCGVTLESSHQAPCGHSSGAPLAQNEPAGHGTHVSWRMRLPARSAV